MVVLGVWVFLMSAVPLYLGVYYERGAPVPGALQP